MREFRLVPAAVVVWLCTMAVIGDRDALALGLIACVVLVAWCCRQRGQAIVTGAVALVAVVASALRRSQAREFEFAELVQGTITRTPVAVESGGHMVPLRLPGLPGELAVFVDELPEGADSGAVVQAAVETSATDRLGLVPVVATGEVTALHPAGGLAGWSNMVAERFREAVEAHVGHSSQGLIPGMVLGDTGLQDAAEQQLYIETGLSHLSAVSGANVSLVCAAAVLACRGLSLGPRWQVAGALAALALFVTLVGTEPSVLRAGVTGVVGLLAIVNSSRMEPMHALAMAVIALVLVDSSLAVNYGFALSVSATAGIVMLVPLLHRVLAPTGWPDIVLRALAVAIAADIVTMPIIALMAGEVSVVSVLANVLVGPATPVVTILGLLAAALAQLPDPVNLLAWPVLKIVEPCTWWINTVALGARSLPMAIIPAHPLAVLLGYGWIVVGLLYHRPVLTFALTLVGLGALAGFSFERPAAELNLSELTVHAVEREEDIEPIPPGTQVIVVGESGLSRDRPSRTAGGIPVLYPHRDGHVTVHSDGTQHAADGRF